MPDSLLSRFDLIFIITDQKTAENDKRVSERVTRNHRLAPIVPDTGNQFAEDEDFVIQPIERNREEESMY